MLLSMRRPAEEAAHSPLLISTLLPFSRGKNNALASQSPVYTNRRGRNRIKEIGCKDFLAEKPLGLFTFVSAAVRALYRPTLGLFKSEVHPKVAATRSASPRRWGHRLSQLLQALLTRYEWAPWRLPSKPRKSRDTRAEWKGKERTSRLLVKGWERGKALLWQQNLMGSSLRATGVCVAGWSVDDEHCKWWNHGGLVLHHLLRFASRYSKIPGEPIRAYMQFYAKVWPLPGRFHIFVVFWSEKE